MKKLLLLLMIAMISSCTVQQSLTSNQAHNIRKFSHRKHIRPTAGPRYIRPRKRGDIMSKSVCKSTRKALIRNIKRQRTTAGGQ